MKIEKLLQFVCLQFYFCGCFAVSLPPTPRDVRTDTRWRMRDMNMYEGESEARLNPETLCAAPVMNEYFLHT